MNALLKTCQLQKKKKNNDVDIGNKITNPFFEMKVTQLMLDMLSEISKLGQRADTEKIRSDVDEVLSMYKVYQDQALALGDKMLQIIIKQNDDLAHRIKKLRNTGIFDISQSDKHIQGIFYTAPLVRNASVV